jgi:hypothetical protein
MAELVPTLLALNRQPIYSKHIVYKRDTYNFSSVSITNGDLPKVAIPATGPNAAGATVPNASPAVDHIDLVLLSNPVKDYGVNMRS